MALLAIPAIEIGLLLTLLVALGSLYAYRATGKPMLYLLADVFDGLNLSVLGRSLTPFGAVAAWCRWAALEVDHQLARLVFATEGAVVYFWHALANLFAALGHALGDLAESVETRLRYVETVVIPRAMRRAVEQARAASAATAATVATIATVTLPRIGAELDDIRGILRGLDRSTDRAWSWLRRHERALVGAGAAALVISALGRLGLGWVRCQKVKRVGKRACQMDADIFDALLVGTVAVAGAVSLREFVRELQGMTDEGIEALRATIREL